MVILFCQKNKPGTLWRSIAKIPCSFSARTMVDFPENKNINRSILELRIGILIAEIFLKEKPYKELDNIVRDIMNAVDEYKGDKDV